ncbi:MAG: hypothetical protein U0746_10180 [Gemmataceae bacterium]
MRRLMATLMLAVVPVALRARAADPPTPKEVFAQVTTDTIARREEELAAAADRTAAAVRAFSVQNAASQDRTFEEFQKLIAIVRVSAEDALAGQAEFRKACEGLRKALLDAPAAYRLAAESYRQKAETYETAELRRRVLDLADNCERLIPVMEERVRRLDAMRVETARMEKFLGETTRFIGDVEGFLKLYPGGGSLEFRRTYLTQLDSYKRSFEGMLKALDGFTDRLKAESTSERLRSENPAATRARAAEARARVQALAALPEEHFRNVEAVCQLALKGPHPAADMLILAEHVREARRQRAATGGGS